MLDKSSEEDRVELISEEDRIWIDNEDPVEQQQQRQRRQLSTTAVRIRKNNNMLLFLMIMINNNQEAHHYTLSISGYFQEMWITLSCMSSTCYWHDYWSMGHPIHPFEQNSKSNSNS